jgi:dTDP-glucose 4,6-dehydratase
MKMGNILVTGGLGFIGSHFVRMMLSKDKHDISHIINLDYGGYGSNPDNLLDVQKDSRYQHVDANINDTQVLDSLAQNHDIDAVVNFAAETHVDRSIANPSSFLASNTNGVVSLLEFCRTQDIPLYVQVSTDEVYGDAFGKESLDEKTGLQPNSPYSASKASGDLFVKAYTRTYGLGTAITRCSNNFGPNQFPEKLIPKTIIRALRNLAIPIYGDGKQSREWLYVEDHVAAVAQVIEKGRKTGEVYNISSSTEVTNVEIVDRISNLLAKYKGTQTQIEHVPDRPGHDRRYSIDCSKIAKEVDWRPAHPFDKALDQTVKWYLDNEWWWKPLVNESVLHPQPWTLSWKEGK